MKGIVLWQPWAQLVVLGLKRWETRSWATKHRGVLAIVAARRPPFSERELLEDDRGALRRLYGALMPYGWTRESLPRGAVVGTVALVDCLSTEEVLAREPVARGELEAGNFAPGRFAWLLASPFRLETPKPWRGRQGFFDVPAELLRHP